MTPWQIDPQTGIAFDLAAPMLGRSRPCRYADAPLTALGRRFALAKRAYFAQAVLLLPDSEDIFMQLKHLAGLALIASLSACSSMDGASSDSAAAAAPDRFKDKCNAEVVQDMLGQRVTPDLSKQIKEKAGAKSVRVLGPTDAMTMDYKSTRLNIDTDEAEVIDRITCG